MIISAEAPVPIYSMQNVIEKPVLREKDNLEFQENITLKAGNNL